MRQVQIYSRHGCHLCEQALSTLQNLQSELDFEIQEIFIENDPQLTAKFGDLVPVIHIDNVHHDFYRVDPIRFRKSFNQAR